MAAVEVTITGLLFDKLARTTQNVVLIGEATLTGLGPGGGPIIPPPVDKPPGKPPGIWPGPGDPDYPGKPPTVWPGPGDPDYPGRPPEGEKPPIIPPDQPPVQWKPVWTPNDGWVVVGVINPEIEHPVPSA